jgi:glycosyltransferase involved in cell wall biosynthesis
MRVLLAHNYYRSAVPSGENAIVDAEIGLLRDGGVEVVPLLARSDDITGPAALAAASLGPLYSRNAVQQCARLLAASQPNVVHAHNVFPLLSPSIVRVAHAAGVPVVQTVHNYRHTCINGQHFRNGGVCEECFGRRLPLKGVAYGCYRGSRVQSLPMAAGQLLHRGTWRSVDLFLALTEFMAQRLIASGVDASRVRVRPTWTADPGEPAPVGRDVLFVGRLDEQKGLRLLLDAWRSLDVAVERKLLIAGDGPLVDEAVAVAAADPRVQVLGHVSAFEVQALMRRCGIVAVPSLSFEGYPLVIAEAFSHGRGVLVTNGMSAGSAVPDGCGLHIERTVAAWRECLSTVSDLSLARWGMSAREHYERNSTPERALETLLEAYRSVALLRANGTTSA